MMRAVLVRAILLALAYFLASRLGMALLAPSERVALFWPPSGLLLGALIVSHRRNWWVYLLAVLPANIAANMLADKPFLVSFGYALVNGCESLMGAWLLCYFFPSGLTLSKLTEVFCLTVVGVLVSTLAALGGASLSASALNPAFWSVWREWCLADAVGILLVTPLLVTWADTNLLLLRTPKPLRILEGICCFIALVSVTWLIFSGFSRSDPRYSLFSLPFPIFLVMLWIALRFGRAGTSTAVATVSLLAVLATAQGLGPFTQPSLPFAASVVLAQGFLAILGLFSFVLAAAIQQRQFAEGMVAERAQLAALEAAVSTAVAQGKDLHDTVQQCTEILVEHLDMAFARIWILDVAQNVLVLKASAGMYTHIDGPHSRVPVGHRKIGLIVAEGRPHMTNSVIGDPLVGEQEWARREGMVAFAGHPLQVAGQPVGVMAMFARRPLSPYVLAALGTVADVIALGIEKKRVEESRDRFFTLSLDMLCIASLDGYFRRLNPAFSETLGYSTEELLARPFLDFVHPEDEAATRAEVAKLGQGFPMLHFENRYRCKDGCYRTLAWKCAPVEDGLLYASARDVTEQRLVENALRESGDRLRLALNNARHGMWDWDIVSGNLTLDENSHAVLGYQPGELPRTFQAWEQALHPDDWERNQVALQKHLESSESLYDIEYRSLDKSGKWIWINTRGRVHQRDDSGKPLRMMGTIHDVSDRKEAEATLSQRAEDLARSNAELEQFAYVASHDLREPLRMVQSFCGLLKERYADQLDDRAKTYIGFAVDGAARMQHLINDLLEYSRVGRSNERFSIVSLTDVVQHAKTNLEVAIAESRAVIDIGKLPNVHGDAMRLCQVFQNLIANAIKFGNHEPPRVQVTACRQGDAWRITVADNGIGIDPKHVQRLFVVFQRLHTKAEYPGTGIGLALCKRIIELHGGRIWLDSKPGHGTSVHFLLPPAKVDAPIIHLEGAGITHQTVTSSCEYY